MPRYFFNLRRGPGEGKLTPDPEGDELAGEDLIRAHALGIVCGLMKTRSHAVRDWMACSFEVTDEADRLVATIPFGEIVADDD